MKLSKYNFSLPIWVLLIGILLLRIGTSMSIPFLSIFLHFKVGISLPITGAIVGLSYLSYVGGGIIGGILSDKYGRGKLFGLSLIFYALTFFGFGATASIAGLPTLIACLFCLLNLLGGLFRIWSETLGQAMLADLVEEEQKVAAFSLRYTAINIGGALGPALGAAIGLAGTMTGFYLTGVMCLGYFILFTCIAKNISDKINCKSEHVTFSSAISTLLHDKALLYFIIGGLFACLLYVQHESTLGQILVQRFNNSNLFATLLVLNAATVVCFQIPLTNYCMKNTKQPLTIMMSGCLFLFLGFLGMAHAGMSYILYIASEIIFSVGEMLTFPLGAIFVDNIAPKKLRGAYFGATSFQFFGKAIGPALGGFVLQNLGGPFTLSIFATLALVTIFFYHKGLRQTTPLSNELAAAANEELQ
jgi:MFS family permease